MSHSFITDPRVQQFVDDAALGAKVRALLPTLPDDTLLAKREERIATLEAQVAALTAERDALLAARPVTKFKAGQRVRFVSKVASAHDGAVGTIVTVRPNGLFVVGFKNWMLDGCYAEDQLAPEGAQP